MQHTTGPGRLEVRSLLAALTTLAEEAAAVIRKIAAAPVDVRHKSDHSPVTDADTASEAVILRGLARILPGVPVVSEEGAAAAPAPGATFVLVDPLDGTREFIAGRGEYTVNIALIAAGAPVLGVVAAPASGLVWRGAQRSGAERLTVGAGEPAMIRTRAWPAQAPVALVSRSHLDVRSAVLVDGIPGMVRREAGSALKFCLLAEGTADLYPRLAPTHEWDVAAGHALLVAAGGTVLTPRGGPVLYGTGAEAFRLPAFIALGDPAAAGRCLSGL